MRPKTLRDRRGPKYTPPQKDTLSLSVSDHAVLRYMERVLGFDVRAIRLLIWEEAGPAAAMGLSHYRVGPITYCYRDGNVATITVNEADLPAVLVPLPRAQHKP